MTSRSTRLASRKECVEIIACTKELMPDCATLVFDHARLCVLREMCAYAAHNGGRCVRILQGGGVAHGERPGCAPGSVDWHEDPETLFELQCRQGHSFAGSMRVLRQQGWCPVCDEASLREAHMALLGAESGEDIPALRRAIEAAEAMHVGADLVRCARTRLSELCVETEQQARCAELGAGPNEVSLPNEFICPITQERMVDPVVASDGHTYERTAIEEVMRCPMAVSPLTREELQLVVFPNQALKSRIRSYHGDVLHLTELVNKHARAKERQRLVTLAKLARSRRIDALACSRPPDAAPASPVGMPPPDQPVGHCCCSIAAAAGKRARTAATRGADSHQKKSVRLEAPAAAF